MNSNLAKVDCCSGFNNSLFSGRSSCEVFVFRRAGNYYKRTIGPHFSGWCQ